MVVIYAHPFNRRWASEDRQLPLLAEGEDDRSLAMHFKEKGNELYAKGNVTKPEQARSDLYRAALDHYNRAFAHVAEALRPPYEATEQNTLLLSTILTNRAIVHIKLRNYGGCRRDCVKAIAAWPANVKAYFRCD